MADGALALTSSLLQRAQAAAQAGDALCYKVLLWLDLLPVCCKSRCNSAASRCTSALRSVWICCKKWLDLLPVCCRSRCNSAASRCNSALRSVCICCKKWLNAIVLQNMVGSAAIALQEQVQ